MLDSRAPPAQIAEEEKKREEATENEIQRLAHEARIWRPANSAQWVAWGIVQAKVEGMDEALEAKKKKSSSDNADYVSSSAEDREKTESESTASGPVDPLSQETGDVKNQRPEEETGGATGDGDAGGEGGDEFDYLGYAQERAMFFWGDVLQMGLIAKEELPEEVRKRVKVVEY